MRPADTNRTCTLNLRDDVALRRRYMVVDAPLQGNLRFGLLLEVLDKLAEETALHYARQVDPAARVVTAAVDNILIRHPPDVTRDIHFSARINFVGRSSMEVGIRVTQAGDPDVHVASCYFTMVARLGFEDDARSLTLPPLQYADDLERHRAERAQQRRDDYRRRLAAAEEPPTREEYDLLTQLRREQEQPTFRGLLAGRLVTDSWERMYPEQENVPRKIFGGYVMRHAYELSSMCAELAAPDRPVLAAVNRVNFFRPLRIGDSVHYTSRVVYATGALVFVEASIERRSRDRTTRALSNSCLFTFVNVDAEMRPRAMPPVYPTTYSEDARLLEARRYSTELARYRGAHFGG